MNHGSTSKSKIQQENALQKITKLAMEPKFGPFLLSYFHLTPIDISDHSEDPHVKLYIPVSRSTSSVKFKVLPNVSYSAVPPKSRVIFTGAVIGSD